MEPLQAAAAAMGVLVLPLALPHLSARSVFNTDAKASWLNVFLLCSQTLSTPSSVLLAPTLGFASNLSHTIIKEAHEDDARSAGSVDTVSTSVSITDEELALLGAPWAKEGMLCRKQFWETSKRRARTRTWMNVFVVISKGEFSMFTFGANGPSSSVDTVGGGNWLVSVSLLAFTLKRWFENLAY